MKLVHEVLEEGIECMSISMGEKELLDKYEELEKRETQYFKDLEKYQGNPETVGRIRQELLEIDRLQDQITEELYRCEDRQIGGHKQFNLKITGGIRFEAIKRIREKNIPVVQKQQALF